MKKVTALLLLIVAPQLFAVNKSHLDIAQHSNDLAKSSGVASDGFFGSKTLSNSYTSYSLMTGGYFTIGTSNGLSDSPFDDQCQLTFGHPYALTSYPLLAIDGVWGKPDEFVADMSMTTLEASGASLIMRATVDKIDIVFQLRALEDGEAIEISMTLQNRDSVDHRLGMGLALDPALGQWGDGALEIDGELVNGSAVFTGEALNSLLLSERPPPPYGLRVKLTPLEEPNHLVVANWEDIYKALPGELGLNGLRDIYDLCLKFIWDEQTVPTQGARSFTVEFRLLTPDFPAKAFLRWDMPTALSIEDNLLFPRRLNTIVRVMNTSGNVINTVSIDAQFPPELQGEWMPADFSIDSASSFYQPMTVITKEIYEDIVVPVQIECEQNGRLLDQLTRNIFIPATPVSDEGLIVKVDSLWLTNDSQVNLVFNVEKEETGQKILNLQKENVLLYDNDARVRDFSLDKYGEGGAGLADVCFVLDCSASMGDNINAVRDNLGEFADSLRARGFDFRIAVVTFSTTVDDVWDFTDDVELMKDRLASIVLWGGIEDSPAALYRASELSWRPGSKRNIIWITDEPYPEESYTKQQIVDRMLALDIRVHGVGLLELQTDWFNPIVLPTGGNFYNIFGNFRDILLDVARMKSQDKYLVGFQLSDPQDAPHQIRLKIHYAGLGGEATVDLNGGLALGKKLACYPNPFNPVVRIKVDAADAVSSQVDIYNVLGRRIRQFQIAPNSATELLWNALDEEGVPVSSGFYIVKFSMQRADGSGSNEMQKVLYLK